MYTAAPRAHSNGLRYKPYEFWPPLEGVMLTPPHENQLGRPSYEVCAQCGFESGSDDNPGTAAPLSFEVYLVEREELGFPISDPKWIGPDPD